MAIKMDLYLPKRKDDQFRTGSNVNISRSERTTCAVAVTELLLTMIVGDRTSSYPHVRRILHTKNGNRFHSSIGIS